MTKPTIRQCRYAYLDLDCGHYNPYGRNCPGFATECEGYTTHITIGEHQTNMNKFKNEVVDGK